MSRSIKRKYTKSKVFDKSCRNNGSCPYCRKNRLYNSTKRMIQSLHGLVSLEKR